ncbi:Glutaminyl-peptide cyclotransferase [Capsicum annuum]|uniref:Glutaminyl-peptide cyclotransferase n=1 Tax=Capsicum annuum TaxID=4072 RepID=A0A1U8FZB4_CAPAN|nr:glutaminyl-peptide cyclotransferase [Capsicum annuum]KAF3638685.1 Glutaminyl-peptide cyclotransferase [Capsicum annuum]PHT87383.1 Glutaminyl-peptide cyclotransferase [Capsicum annuum]
MFLLNLRCIVISLIILLRFIVLSEAEASYGAYKVKVINEFPHDPQAYTQGLLYAENNTLFESTGLYGRSSVRKVALLNGKVETLHEMQYSDFGEGLTLLGERLFQLTWLQDTGFIYDRYNFSKFKMFTHHMQDGWGLATDGEVLFGSDGTSTLYKIDPKTMKVIRKQVVKSQGHEVHYLNELEYVKDEVWANVYETDCIARISPKDGTVIGWILLQSLREDLTSKGYKDFEVLNGIAWDRDGDRIFVTGKLWPKIFEIKLLPLAPNAPLMGEINNLCIPKPFYLGKLES